MPPATDRKTPVPSSPRHGRGRRPADEVRADTLRAVGQLLLSDGITAITFDHVARVAGVSKTTLYKWWPSAGALALDGYFHAVEPTLAFDDTGDIRADLSRQMHSFADVMTTGPGRIIIELVGRMQTDEELGRAYRAFYSSGRRRLAAERMAKAQEIGQIRPEVDPQTVVDQLWGAVYHRLLIPDEPVTRDFIDGLLDNVLTGIATTK